METEPVQIPAENAPIIPEPDVLPMTTPPAVAEEPNEGKYYLNFTFIFDKDLNHRTWGLAQKSIALEKRLAVLPNWLTGSTFRTK